jgi:hypothetical protein
MCRPDDAPLVVDEAGTNTANTARAGWAPRGQRATGHAPRNHGSNVTLVTTLACAADGAPLLVPRLRAGPIVILDTLSAHTSQHTLMVSAAAGCALHGLPAASPDVNPSASTVNPRTSWRRQVATRTTATRDAASAAGLERSTAADATGWFTGCGEPGLPHSS